MKLFALLLLVGVSLAAHGGDRDVPKIKYLEYPRLRGYQPQHTYTYEYTALVTSGFPETEQQFAGLKITCDTDFYFGTDAFAYLKIKNPILYEVNGTSIYKSESLTISPVSDELKPLLERPIKFQYKDGKVGDIVCEEDEPEYILNIKRGILSLIHHNLTKSESSIHNDEPRMYKNWEFSSHGMCENLYDVRYNTMETNTIKGLQISKTLNRKNCTGKPRVFNNVPGVRCPSKDCNIIDQVCKLK